MSDSINNKKCATGFVVSCIVFLIIAHIPCRAADDTGDYLHYRLGVKYKNEKRYDDAIEEFRKVLASYPDNYNAYMHVAEIRLYQDKPDLAVFNLKKALKYNPGWNRAHKLLAESYEKTGQPQNAVNEIQLYMQTCDPAERDSLQKVINRLLSSSKTTVISKDSSVARVDSVSKPVQENKKTAEMNVKSDGSKAKTGNSEADAFFKDAVLLYEQNKYSQALELLKKVREIKPDFSGVYYYAGMIRHKTGQKKMAKINFLRAVDFPDIGYNAHFYLGKIFAEEANYNEAIRQMEFYRGKTSNENGKKEAATLVEEYKKMSGIAQKSDESHAGDTLRQDDVSVSKIVPVPQEKFETAIEIQIDSILSMLTVDTLTDAGQKLLSGIHAFLNGNFDNAIKEFKKTLASNPTGTVAVNCLYNVGICYYKLHLFKEAENQFQQVIDRFPESGASAQSLFLKACTYLERKNSPVAEKIFRSFLQHNPKHAWAAIAFEKLGDAYLDMEQSGKAIDAYVQATAKAVKAVDLVNAQFKLGNAYLKIGNSNRAIESFSSVITAGEKNQIFVRIPDSYYRIADEKYKQKDYTSALDYYIKVTRKYPSFQETPWGMYQIGTIYKNLKRYQEAVAMFKELIRKYPDDYWAKQAQWKMEDAIWENEYKTVLQ